MIDPVSLDLAFDPACEEAMSAFLRRNADKFTRRTPLGDDRPCYPLPSVVDMGEPAAKEAAK